MNKILATLALAVMLAGCAHKNAPLPKGALNTFDADSYQTLMVAQATLNTLKADAPSIEAQVPAFKGILDQAVLDYNAAEGAWQTYHAGGGNTSALESAITALSLDILKLNGLIPTGGK